MIHIGVRVELAGYGFAHVRFHYPTTDRDAERFGWRLLATWETIPRAPRLAIAEFWRAGGGPVVDVFSWLDSDRGVCVGRVTDGGQRIEVSGPIVLSLSDAAAGAVVAHELAHVWQVATGRLAGDLELDADRLAVAWGFNPPDAHEEIWRQWGWVFAGVSGCQ